MLKTISINDKLIQRIVSDELANGLLNAFGFEEARECIKLTSEHYRRIEEIFKWYKDVDPEAGFYVRTNARIKDIAERIEKLYLKFIDEENEYDLDESDVYILKAIMSSSYSDCIASVVQERSRDYGGISIHDELYIKRWLLQKYEKKSNADPDFKEEYLKEEYIEDRFFDLILFPYINLDDIASIIHDNGLKK